MSPFLKSCISISSQSSNISQQRSNQYQIAQDLKDFPLPFIFFSKTSFGQSSKNYNAHFPLFDSETHLQIVGKEGSFEQSLKKNSCTNMFKVRYVRYLCPYLYDLAVIWKGSHYYNL